MKKLRSTHLIPLLAVLLVSAFGPLFLYLSNADEANFSEVLPPLLTFCAVGAVLYVVSCLVIRSRGKSAIIAGLSVLVLTHYAVIEKLGQLILPSLRYWHVVTLVLVVLFHLIYLIVRFMPEELSKDAAKILCLVFGTLIAINMVTGVPKALERYRALKAGDASAISMTAEKETVGKPNIYLFIFDEYANFPQIEDYYGYDNKVLRDFLEKYNFNVSETSCNESIATTTVVTNLVNLDYIVDNRTPPGEKEVLRYNGALFSILQEQGYEVQTVESQKFLNQKSPLENVQSTGASTINGNSLSDLLWQRTILYPFFQKGVSKSMESIMKVVNYMSDRANLPQSDTFTAVYLCFPHAPFQVDENGTAISSVHSGDWEDNQYYLGQYKYATKLMIQMAENILVNDPDSILMIQSDHGARSGSIPRFPLRIMHNSLNTVYFKGEKIEIEGLSLVNTMRAVLNQLLGIDFEMIPVPEDDVNTYSYKGELPA